MARTQSDFRLSTASGASVMLMFSASPDYENAADADTDNTYMVTLTAKDGTNTDTHDVAVTVTNVEEAGTVTLDLQSPTVGAEITAALADPDGMVSGEAWQWSKSTAIDGTFEDITDADSASYTPVEADDGYYLKATVTYDDGEGSGKSADETSANQVTAGDPLVNRYDANGNGEIEKSEVITAINEYLDGDAGAPSKADVIKLINLYLGD